MYYYRRLVIFYNSLYFIIIIDRELPMIYYMYVMHTGTESVTYPGLHGLQPKLTWLPSSSIIDVFNKFSVVDLVRVLNLESTRSTSQ